MSWVLNQFFTKDPRLLALNYIMPNETQEDADKMLDSLVASKHAAVVPTTFYTHAAWNGTLWTTMKNELYALPTLSILGETKIVQIVKALFSNYVYSDATDKIH